VGGLRGGGGDRNGGGSLSARGRSWGRLSLLNSVWGECRVSRSSKKREMRQRRQESVGYCCKNLGWGTSIQSSCVKVGQAERVDEGK